MRHTDVLDGKELRTSLRDGINKLARMVKRTLGPGGLPIILQREGQDPSGRPLNPLVTKDGVTVAEYIKRFEDVHENNALQAIKDVARKTNHEAGDGTTTAIVLAEAIFNEALKYIEIGEEPQNLFDQIQLQAKAVLDNLIDHAKKVETREEIINVGKISANNNIEIGQIINEAIETVGEDGVIVVEEGVSRETNLRTVDGFQIARGLIGYHYFQTNPETAEAILTKPAIIVYNGVISSFSQIVPIVQKIVGDPPDMSMKMFIIANDIVGDALNWLVLNKRMQGLQVACIKSPDATDQRALMLEDIAIMVGANVLGEAGKSLEAATLEDIGCADKVVAGRFFTTIYGGSGDEETILKRVDSLKELRKNAFSEFDKDRISGRIAGLSNGMAVISVGGATKIEVKEKKDRVEDALNATRAAISEGVVPGGGMALYRARETLDYDSYGGKILNIALQAPIRTIILNTGRAPDLIVPQIKEEYESGYNAKSHEIVDMMKDGIIDPVKVVRSALINALSIAGLLATCGGSVAEVD